MTIGEQINLLNLIKSNIRNALIQQQISVPINTPFIEYANLIANIISREMIVQDSNQIVYISQNNFDMLEKFSSLYRSDKIIEDVIITYF